MAGSEAGSGGLLRDLSLSRVRHAQAPSPEQELMRLATDPLLLNGFIHGAERPLAAPPVAVAAEAALALRTPPVPAPSRGAAAYERGERLFEPSLAPTPFAPSQHDRDTALEAEETLAERAGSNPGLLGMLLALGLFGFAIFALTL